MWTRLRRWLSQFRWVSDRALLDQYPPPSTPCLDPRIARVHRAAWLATLRGLRAAGRKADKQQGLVASAIAQVDSRLYSIAYESASGNRQRVVVMALPTQYDRDRDSLIVRFFVCPLGGGQVLRFHFEIVREVCEQIMRGGWS